MSDYSESDIASEDDDWEPDDAPSKKRKRTSTELAGGSSGTRVRGRGRGRGRGSKAAARRRVGSDGSKGHIHDVPNFTDDEVLAQVRELAQLMTKETAPRMTIAELGMTSALEVREAPPAEVMLSIERLIMDAARKIMAGESMTLSVPSRSAANQEFVAELDRIVLKDQRSERSFTNVSQVRKVAITTRVMSLVHEVLNKGIHVTKRDLFYTDAKLFKKQDESDAVLDDVACIMGCTRSNLNVVASEKGLVVGRLRYQEDGDPIDCTRIGVGGKAIPPFIDKITNIQSDAEFILLVEKDAVFMRLAEDRFYNKFPCIIITGKGQPDVATRMFLRRLKATLKIPVLAFVDADPHGLKILSVYSQGSKNMSYDSFSLTCPDIKWLGLLPSDFDKYQLPAQCRLEMSEKDVKTGQDLLKEDFIQKNPEWVAELELMLEVKQKAEIQALSAFGFQFVTEVYLPRKLKAGDWI